jgi:hypothetical protein
VRVVEKRSIPSQCGDQLQAKDILIKDPKGLPAGYLLDA